LRSERQLRPESRRQVPRISRVHLVQIPDDRTVTEGGPSEHKGREFRVVACLKISQLTEITTRVFGTVEVSVRHANRRCVHELSANTSAREIRQYRTRRRKQQDGAEHARLLCQGVRCGRAGPTVRADRGFVADRLAADGTGFHWPPPEARTSVGQKRCTCGIIMCRFWLDQAALQFGGDSESAQTHRR
jgi:hypothetical protein